MELILQNVTKQYKEKKALADVSHVLTEGIYGLLGPNGAGKSTLMNLITGNVKASAGRILWNGEETARLGAAYRGILGYAPQQQGLYETFSGRRFLSYMAALKGISKKGNESGNRASAYTCQSHGQGKQSYRFLFRRYETAPFDCTGSDGES